MLFVRYPTDDAPPEGYFVGIFEVSANRDTPCDGRYFYFKLPQPFGQVESRGVAFHGRAEGQDYFLQSRLLREALKQRLDPQIGGANAFEGRNHPTQHVIQPPILGGVFDGQYVSGIFDHTYQRLVSLGACADAAEFAIRNIETALAVASLGAHHDERLGQAAGLGFFSLEQVQG